MLVKNLLKRSNTYGGLLYLRQNGTNAMPSMFVGAPTFGSRGGAPLFTTSLLQNTTNCSPLPLVVMQNQIGSMPMTFYG